MGLLTHTRHNRGGGFELFHTGIGYAEKFGYSFAWDYGRAETRRHILAVLAEMLDNYELDGLELDFMRHPIYFRRDQHTKNAPLITDLVRKVRAKVDLLAKKTGRETRRRE